MKRVIAVTNQKGGVGKTTTAVNLAASLAAMRRRVLLIDMDPQGNATMGCGVDKASIEHGIGDVVVGDCRAAAAIIPIESTPGLSLLPSNQDLTAAEVRLLTMMAGRELRLRTELKPVREQFDLIVIDCPPALNMLTVNALVAADSVLIPMQCEYYALEGLSALVTTIEQIRASVNPELEIEGILRTMFDPRNNLANEVSSQLMTHFGDKVFRTIVPRNVRLAEAPSFGKPVLLHDRESRGALAYLALAGEMIRRDDDLRGSAMQGINQPIGVPPPVYAPSSDAPSTADPVSDSAGQSAAQSTPAPDEQQSSAPTPPEPEPGDRPEAAASVAGSATPFGSHGH